MFSLCVLPPFLICFCFFYTFRNWRGSQEWKNCQSDWGGGWPFDWHQPQRFTYVLSAWCALFDTDAHLQYAMVCMYVCLNVHICTCVCEWLCDRVYLDVSIRKCWVFCGNFKNVCAYMQALKIWGSVCVCMCAVSWMHTNLCTYMNLQSCITMWKAFFIRLVAQTNLQICGIFFHFYIMYICVCVRLLFEKGRKNVANFKYKR